MKAIISRGNFGRIGENDGFLRLAVVKTFSVFTEALAEDN